MSWLEVSFLVDGESATDVDRLTDTLHAAGALAVTLGSSAGETVLEPAPQATPLWSRTRLTGLFPLDADVAGLRTALGTDVEIAVSFLEARNWLKEWQAHAVQSRFGDRLWVVPRSVEAGLPQELDAFQGAVLRLDPGLAFGTGSHPSTRLCLGWLAAVELTGHSMLDYGCGSGVLAVAGSLLGAEPVVALDHDPQALVATQDNANYNGVSLAGVVLPEALDDDARFAVVVANILANTLIELASELVMRLEPGGRLALAGVLSGQAESVMAAFPGIEFEEPVTIEDWALLAGCLNG